MGGWSLVTPSQIRDYADNQVQWSGNIGWNKGTHNVKAGFDVNRMYVNHYETAVPTFTFNGGARRLVGARHRICSTSLRTFCSACRSRGRRRR